MASVSQLEVTDVNANLALESRQKQLEDDPRWQVVGRIVTTKGFAKSPFLSGFLLYVCEKHLLGLDDEITEQQVGIAVFGRQPGYNVSDDNIVRNYARILRQRLDNYFKTSGADEAVQIVIPRGKYVPLFLDANGSFAETRSSQLPSIELKAENAQLPISADLPPASGMEAAKQNRRIWLLAAACCLLTIALIASWMHRSFVSQMSRENLFWRNFFNPTQDTFLVPGDSGLAIYENLTKTQVDLGSYVRDDYKEKTASPLNIDPKIIDDLGERRYTSVVDLDLVAAISHLPEAVPSRLKIRYARELHMDDLKQANVILLGSVNANPWVDLFQKELNFQFSYDTKLDATVIHNLHPLPGESSIYQTQESSPTRTTYGLIAVVPNLENSGNVLLMEGINMAGTEGAADFLLSDRSTELRDRVSKKDGRILPFEVLIETSNIAANAPRPRIVSLRIREP
jgi:hypothetical protein